eukprot:6102100-Pleurochrysis_carterae.AAC.3
MAHAEEQSTRVHERVQQLARTCESLLTKGKSRHQLYDRARLAKEIFSESGGGLRGARAWTDPVARALIACKHDTCTSRVSVGTWMDRGGVEGDVLHAMGVLYHDRRRGGGGGKANKTQRSCMND